jgi:hypothetical protein
MQQQHHQPGKTNHRPPLPPPLLILDLNGVLCLSQHKKVAGVKEDARANVKYLYFRPYLEHFLRFCFQKFRVAIWSSNAKHNVTATVEQIIRNREDFQRLKFVWSRMDCELGFNYSSFKNLEYVHRRFGTSPSSVFILDDSPEKIRGRGVFIKVPSYNVPNERDTVLLDMIKQLESNLQVYNMSVH